MIDVGPGDDLTIDNDSRLAQLRVNFTVGCKRRRQVQVGNRYSSTIPDRLGRKRKRKCATGGQDGRQHAETDAI